MDPKRDVEIVQAESEDTRDQPLPSTARGEQRGRRSVVQSVRVSEDEFAEIERLAGEVRVSVSALIRGWYWPAWRPSAARPCGPRPTSLPADPLAARSHKSA